MEGQTIVCAQRRHPHLPRRTGRAGTCWMVQVTFVPGQTALDGLPTSPGKESRGRDNGLLVTSP
ncbi:hypothetical protein ABZS81_04255 [Streptomyces sp. NPDC005318]|uniref:hypothetical protein n=1 Tax=Streptomyces sp. NPDC005318 TaxID=3157031 RepID=UPI0033A4E44C